jgi:L-threonylcarbamoyladenylate synthase
MIEISNDVSKAKLLLEKDEIIAIPTETVYGLAGNIYSETAIKKIFSTKKRPFYNPLIVHISSINVLQDIAINIPEKALLLAAKFWPGSLTLVLQKNDSIPDLITAGKNTVAIRVPNHELTLNLLKSLRFPLAAPSANPFGQISPTTAQHVAEYFSEEIPMVLDGGNCSNGIESTIIGFENNKAILLRLGSIAVEEIEVVIGKITIKNQEENAPLAPGMLSRHYAPKTKTVLVDNILAAIEENLDKKIGLLLFKDAIYHEAVLTSEILSENGDLKTAASNLYAAMHTLDKQNLEIIIAQRFPENNLGNSINDRLQRATKN